MANARRSTEPTDRLTRLCDAAIEAFDAHPEHTPGDKAIIFVDSETDQRAGLVLHGYEDDADAMANLISHLVALFEANGMRMELHTLPTMGQG